MKLLRLDARYRILSRSLPLGLAMGMCDESAKTPPSTLDLCLRGLASGSAQSRPNSIPHLKVDDENLQRSRFRAVILLLW